MGEVEQQTLVRARPRVPSASRLRGNFGAVGWGTQAGTISKTAPCLMKGVSGKRKAPAPYMRSCVSSGDFQTLKTDCQPVCLFPQAYVELPPCG